MGQLDAAVKAYRASLHELDVARAAAATRVKAAQQRADRARTELAAAIVAEAQGGARQVDIIRATGLSRERVRQILRQGGVEPDD